MNLRVGLVGLLGVAAVVVASCGLDAQADRRSDNDPRRGVAQDVHGIYKQLTLAEFVDAAEVIAVVVVEGREVRDVADNPQLPEWDDLEGESKLGIERGVQYEEISVRVEDLIKGQVGPTLSVMESAPDDVPDRQWYPKVGERFVIFASHGEDVWTGGVLLISHHGAPPLDDETVQFYPEQPLLPPGMDVVTVDDLMSMAGA